MEGQTTKKINIDGSKKELQRVDNMATATSKTRCQENIRKKYANAKCIMLKDKSECRSRCEKMGNDECHGKKGEIHKLNCKGEKKNLNGMITCCCAANCESTQDTQHRLDQELQTEIGNSSSGICVEADRMSIKDKLKELCSKEDRVFVARKYCIEERKGQYFCVKDGKCFGKQCKGCIKHECEVLGKKELINPPASYMERHLKSKDFDKNVAVNVDDMKDVEKVKQWCTMVRDRKQCSNTCRDFGDRICSGRALKYDHDDLCKKGASECKCCCKPVCRGSPKEKSLVDVSRENG